MRRHFENRWSDRDHRSRYSAAVLADRLNIRVPIMLGAECDSRAIGGKRHESTVYASLASFSSRSHRHDFIAQFARDLFAISGSNFRDRKRALRADFAFEKKIKEMRQQCHVTPVADLIGNRTIVERVFDSRGGDRTMKLHG